MKITSRGMIDTLTGLRGNILIKYMPDNLQHVNMKFFLELQKQRSSIEIAELGM